MLYSSQRSSMWFGHPPGAAGTAVTAFHPLCQIAREPSIVKKAVSLRVGASASSKL